MDERKNSCEDIKSWTSQKLMERKPLWVFSPSNEQGELTASWLQVNWLSLRNNWLKFKTFGGKLPIILKESLEYTSSL